MNNERVTIIRDRDGDWCAVYHGDNLVYEGLEPEMGELLQAVGVPHTYEEVEEETDMPRTLTAYREQQRKNRQVEIALLEEKLAKLRAAE